MNHTTKAKIRRRRRPLPEIRKEFEAAKQDLHIFSFSRDTDEAYYQYWRGVRNALMWVIYWGHPSPIRSDEAWETEKGLRKESENETYKSY